MKQKLIRAYRAQLFLFMNALAVGYAPPSTGKFGRQSPGSGGGGPTGRSGVVTFTGAQKSLTLPAASVARAR